MAKFKKSNRKKPKFSSGEKRAYWVGVGFHSAYNLDMKGFEVECLMSKKEKESFVNGRKTAEDLSAKFVPDLVSGSYYKNKNKKGR